MTVAELQVFLFSLPPEMEVYVSGEHYMLPLCAESDIEQVINENEQSISAFVMKPCVCGRDTVPVSTKLNQN